MLRTTTVGSSYHRVSYLAVIALLAVGCSRGAAPGPAPPAPVDVSLDRLADAIDLVNDGRATVLERVGVVILGLERRDALDALAAVGDSSGARQLDEPADAAFARSAPAVNDVGIAVEAFQKGLDDLATAALTRELDTSQRRFLGTVVAEGRREISVTRSLANAVRVALPVYGELGAQIDEWLRRARAGWYRSQTEAANAYAVLVGGVRSRLDAAQTAVTTADGARVAAVTRTTTAINIARRSLSPLTTRPTEVAVTPTGLAG